MCQDLKFWGPNEYTSHVDDEIFMADSKPSYPVFGSLKMYRSIWEGFFLFVLFFKPCLSTCFCLLKYSYSFYLILSHLTYKRKQMRMQTESFSLCCKVKYRNWGTHMLIVNGLIEELHSFKAACSVSHSPQAAFTNSACE